MYLKGSQVEFSINYVFLSLNFVLILANSADPDAAFRLGLHCLPKYPLWGLWYTKGYKGEKTVNMSNTGRIL